ncbi:DUF1631 domain-containing protein [Thiocapsa marina]|uniref:Thymidine phosphorylase n=1 Tax=Thiocapsa marina 5811 TaxID=768671 RepID=F9UCF9_9GAMM|nr:DUF1631 domain-containing protein [Thiocapsa marina]EGV18072.1 protein of unknown function DUF1631 [Thiocapsa marina 5811]
MADTIASSPPPPEMPDVVAGLTPTDAAALLTGCRDRLAHGLATVFAQHLGGASEDFLGMADRATSLEQQQLYFSAMDFLDNRGQQLLQQFRSAYVACFDASVAALQSKESATVMHETDELRLVDTDDFERDLAIGKLSARAACNCSQQLTGLDRRLAALLHVPRISQDDNPLYPRTVFSAMLQALNDLDVREQLALILLHEFERQTSVELPGVYADLNRFLVQSGVLPTIPLAGPLSAPRSEPPDQPGGGVGGMSGWAGFEPSEDSGLLAQEEQGVADQGGRNETRMDSERLPRLANDDVFGQLARAIQTASRGRIARTQPAPGAAKGGPKPGGQETPAFGLTQLIDALNALQRGFTDFRQIPGLKSANIDPRRGDVLQQIRAAPMMMWSRPLDAMTIDIVARLFDAIFNDPELSATVRAELAKLQIPVLKVALVDKSFFSDRRHPARRLLDVVASSGIGRNEKDEPRLVDKVREIVDAVVDGFDADLNVFAVQTYKLEEFLREEEEHAQSKSQRVFDQLEQRDRQEIAASRVGEELATRTTDSVLPVLVASFFDRFWRRVLVDVFVRFGDSGEPWREALATMDDLIWSVKPKDTAQERSRLLTALPDLLKRLRRGLETVHLEEAWDPFFDRLIRLHMGALHKEPPPEQTSDPMFNQDAFATSAPELLQTAGAASAPEFAEDMAQGEDSTPTSDETGPPDQYLLLARSLEVGDWVEFQSFRGTRKTLRLGWVSKYRGVYLFTNRQGDNALTLATTSLAGHLRKGTARVLSQDPLTDRAVAQVLEQVMPETSDPA